MRERIVILAAGGATRFGSPKQLVDWVGKPLVRHVAEEALAVRDDVVVVVGAHAEAVRGALDGLPCRAVNAYRHAAGMGASIKAGLTQLAEKQGVLVTLVDLPLVTRAHFARLLAEDDALVAATFDDTLAPPALFRGAYVRELAGLADGSGAKAVLQRHRAVVKAVPIAEARLDVDTLADLERARKAFQEA